MGGLLHNCSHYHQKYTRIDAPMSDLYTSPNLTFEEWENGMQPANLVTKFRESTIRDMTRLALDHNAINLSQGFPNFGTPEPIKKAAIQAIQKRWPLAQITWVIGKVEHQLVKGLQNVEFVVFDKSAGLTAYRDLKKTMRYRHFDILLHMQVSLRANLASLCINASQKWGFDRARAREGQWLFTNRKIKAQSHAHVAEGFMAFAHAIGLSDEYPLTWNIPIDLSELAWFNKRFSELNKYIVISPAASEKERNWLPERYAALADYAHYCGYEVVLCGGGSQYERDLAAKIIAHCCNKPINLVAKTNLRQLLLVIKNARLLLAPDTGPVHMAVAVDTPVIGLYMHSNPMRTGPYKFQRYVVSHYESHLKETTGRTSQSFKWGKRLKGDNLMAQISVDEVKAMFDRVVSEIGDMLPSEKISAEVKTLPVNKAI